MPPKKKVIKEKKQKKIKQKQKQTQSQKVIINLNEVKSKPKRTRKKATNKNIKFDEISTNDMGPGWAKYGAPDEREINTLRGKLTDVENKLLSIKNVENPVNSDRSRMLKIEEGMKNMAILGKDAIDDLYSKFDNIGDFSNKTNFRNPVKEQQKKQSQKIYIEKENPIFQDDNKKNVGRPKKYTTEEERKNAISERNKKTREKMKETKKDTSKKEIEESELKNVAFKERIAKLRANLNQQRQDVDEKYNFQRGFVDKQREQAERSLMGENDDPNLKEFF